MKKNTLACAITMLLCANSHAEGFKLYEQSVSAMGNAYAGRGAQITDASLVYSNPAALTALPGAQLASGLTLIHVESDYQNVNAKSANGQSVVGRSEGTNSLNAPVPFFFYSQPINDRITVGAGLYAPFGLSSDYENDWAGRYFADETAIQVVALQGSIGYEVTEHWSLGLGVALNRVNGTLSKYKDHSGLCELGPNINAMVGANVYQAAYCDSHYEVQGDDYAPSFSFGLYGEPISGLRVAAVYHSETAYHLTGDSVITNTPITGANVAGSPNYIVVSPTLPAIDKSTGKLAVNSQLVEASTLDLTTPASLTLSLDQQLSKTLSWQASLAWTGWHSFRSIDIVSRADTPTISRATQTANNLNSPGYIGFIPEHWQDSYSAALGLTWQLANGDTIKSGIAYDESPIEAAHRTARVPTNDRLWWTLGYGTQFNKHWSFDIAAGYMWMDQVHVTEREYNVQEVALYRSSLTVDYKNTALLLGAQVNYRF